MNQFNGKECISRNYKPTKKQINAWKKVGKQMGLANKGKKLSFTQKHILNLKKARQTAKPNYSRKHGEKVIRHGYVYVFLEGRTDGRCFREHWLIIEKYLGRLPKSPEETHHINEIKTDNRIQNLILFKNYGVHAKFHKFGDTKIKTGDIIFDGRQIKEEKT